ncbi:alpha/beta hydrolase [Frankia sp. AgB1.9]|uniref:alpha/beta fold hydrolase n=1 Tax=unclassified Frankia TaxID=2632575 RepID=UPI001933AF9E|nr:MULTISPECIES: alpha/beta hydrolase [unclassified Frankia]MBL7489994.1 alpha/beta hydrolase [Frankia sp. AgW1.1]MBL7550583.1 alpha/beta hydrolase [Frankia sp. AgB1.9]MBL7619824.1 alpha/beta hydrolase [Frankia sp. AgB1.8]
MTDKVVASGPAVFHRTVDVGGIRIFYRESGDPDRPTIVLFHGFPSSSSMYRNLIPLLAPHFHVLAPDYPGSGNSEFPVEDKWVPSFANLADVMEQWVEKVGLDRFIFYMQDFGGPVGFRLAVKHPDWVAGLVVQNANLFLEGFPPQQAAAPGDGGEADQESTADKTVTVEFAKFLYQTGARNPELLSPDAWNLDAYALTHPDSVRIQRALITDYPTNIARYPAWQAYLRELQPRTLIVWGRNDQFFVPAGAEAIHQTVTESELRFFDTSHFALEEDLVPIAQAIVDFHSTPLD